jgi:hypothetical protein
MYRVVDWWEESGSQDLAYRRIAETDLRRTLSILHLHGWLDIDLQVLFDGRIGTARSHLAEAREAPDDDRGVSIASLGWKLELRQCFMSNETTHFAS